MVEYVALKNGGAGENRNAPALLVTFLQRSSRFAVCVHIFMTTKPERLNGYKNRACTITVCFV